MEARIASFRGSRLTRYDNHMIIHVDTSKNREDAEKLVGKSVTWESTSKKQLKGKIAGAHGNNGRVRAIFESGMPGQSLGAVVKIE
ncbi:MAG: 50S ribosomal protein L35ae [Candidatus Woesearchaeota archaeon]|nr:50S ribosomal protein L35ae [Candidatus Woesearchaeota archaeon]MDP7181970.1 50S ribosomal protein L35ae [Candidatus Woesearchaeota archaeon]MDP7198978.1 50S ribosomal protein L35ae [Candidatus Woesearchaeota archaeon]MDP7467358.1 50S ribosomal protein L35ae [Candidatus Woesearchaeota archaeon]MDP7646588.1 50S ribosomal protein L35ae [Candidatus Woesearchaeota archaeon]